MSFGCIILAAGNGSRFGSQKQFLTLDNTPLWEIVYNKCKKNSNEIVVVGVDVAGGNTRQESVSIGLNYIKQKYVLILEAARPLVTEEQILKLGLCNPISTTFSMPLVDTVYSYDKGFLNRDDCVRLQTPQAFSTEMLKIAHNDSLLENATDDTIVFHERWGVEPTFFPGGENLFKVTYPSDIFVLEKLWEKYQF